MNPPKDAEDEGERSPRDESALAFTVYERHLAVAVLCSDLAHGLSPAMTFLREILREAQMSDTDRSIGEEELGRLKGLMAALRRTKRRELAPRVVDVEAAIQSAVERVFSESHGASRATVTSQPATIRAQERALELTLVCLLRNAFEAAPAGQVLVATRVEGDQLGIEVSDDGPGLLERMVDGMYHPLAALAPDGRGTGLAVVLRLARDHGWELTHARREGCTVFTLAIPLRGQKR